MTISFQKYDVPLGTIDQSASGKRTLPGALSRCENATFPKTDRIDKRRGLALITLAEESDSTPIDPYNVFHNVFEAHGELLLVGHDTLYGLVDRGGAVGDGALVTRGPTLRGNAEVRSVATAQLSE